MKKRRKIGAWIMALVMVLTMVVALDPVSVKAEDEDNKNYYIDLDGDKMTLSDIDEITNATTALGKEGQPTWYIVKRETVTTDVRVSIIGEVNVILADGCTWNANKGISATKSENEDQNKFTIWAQSEGGTAGCLNAYAEDNQDGTAAIGAESNYVKDTESRSEIVNAAIEINGGNINAVGDGGPGIGSASGNGTASSKAVDITINAGHVVSEGTKGAPGIGAGCNAEWPGGGCSCENIVINGGIVEAYGSQYGAGIGTGYSDTSSHARDITINGGKVTAIGGDYAAGIGSGTAYSHSSVRNSRAENITINGGTVYAVGGREGQGIGSYFGVPEGKTDNRSDYSGLYNFKITGGSVYLEGMDGASSEVLEAYENSNLLDLMQPVRPTNAQGQVLEMMEIQVRDEDTKVSLDSSVKTGGDGIISNYDKKVYLWLPEQDFVMPVAGNIILGKGYYNSVDDNAIKGAGRIENSNYILNNDYTLETSQTLRVDSEVTLTVKGQLEIKGSLINNGTVILEGGYYKNLSAFNGSLIIKGGSYEVDPSQYVAEGYMVEKTGSVYKVSKYVHKHSGVKCAGKGASCTADGWKDYYKCSCNKYYANQNCTEEIKDLQAWIKGAGKIPATGHKTELKNNKAASYFEKGYTGDIVCVYCHNTITKGKAIDVLKLKATAFSKAKSSKAKTISLSWSKVKEASGYLIQYSTDKSLKKGLKKVQIKKNSTVSYSLSKLSSKKTYYVRIRAYKTGKVNGKSVTVYTGWSKGRAVKVK